jgi:hypothetical protein
MCLESKINKLLAKKIILFSTFGNSSTKLSCVMDHLHWRHLLAKPSVTATFDCHMTVLALPTLGDMTQIG